MAGYFFARNGEKNGPYTAAEFKSLAATGKIVPSDMVWKEGMPQWVVASAIKGLFPERRDRDQIPTFTIGDKEVAGTQTPRLGKGETTRTLKAYRESGKNVVLLAAGVLVAAVVVVTGIIFGDMPRRAAAMKADAEEYARLDRVFQSHLKDAKALQASGDNNASLSPLLESAKIGQAMAAIRTKYKSASDARDAEFLRAVEMVEKEEKEGGSQEQASASKPSKVLGDPRTVTGTSQAASSEEKDDIEQKLKGMSIAQLTARYGEPVEIYALPEKPNTKLFFWKISGHPSDLYVAFGAIFRIDGGQGYLPLADPRVIGESNIERMKRDVSKALR